MAKSCKYRWQHVAYPILWPGFHNRNKMDRKRIKDVQVDKENVRSAQQSVTQKPGEIRCPRARILSDIDCNNFPAQARQLKRALSESKEVSRRLETRKIFKRVVQPETKEECSKPRIKIEAHPKVTIRKQSPICLEDEVFLDSTEHLAFQRENRVCVSVQTQQPIEKQVVPRRKATLSAKYYGILMETDGCSQGVCMPAADFSVDILKHSLANDAKLVQSMGFLAKHNPSISARADVLHWLMEIQNFLGVHSSVMFITTRLFDSVLAAVEVSKEVYKLMAMVTFWIVHKYDNNRHPLMATTLALLCNGIYKTRDFLNMEIMLLKHFKFDVSLPDVTFYLEHLAEQQQQNGLEQKRLIMSAMYALESYIIHPNFSTLLPSVQAQAAMAMAAKHLEIPLKSHEFLTRLEDVIDSMEMQVRRVQDAQCTYHEPYKKYAHPQKLAVSTTLQQKLLVL